MFGRRRKPIAVPSVSPFPGRCADPAIDASLLYSWQCWLDDGCPGLDDIDPESEQHRAASAARRAATSTSEGELCDLARSKWAWVRLTVACNQHTPVSALWGDGKVWFGLAGDNDSQVKAAALFTAPEPPQVVVDAVIANAKILQDQV